MSDDLARFREVLALCKAEGILVSSVRVGSLEVKIAGRVVAARPSAPDVSDRSRSVTEEEASQKKKLVELRKRSQAQFGKVLPDEALLAMEGAL